MPALLRHHRHHFLRRHSTTTPPRPRSETLTLAEAMSFRSSPSTSSLNSLLLACLLSGHPHLAPSFFFLLRRPPRLPPDFTTFNTLLRNLAALSSASSFFSLLPLMPSPDLSTFSIAIAAFYSERNLPALDSLLLLMARRTYAHLVLGCCVVRDLDAARRAFDEMWRKGIMPESACYFSLAHYLCRGGEFEAAAAVCRESIGRNWVPRFGTMRMLMEGLAGEGRADEARGFVEEVKRRFPGSAELWKEVEEGLPK